MRLAKFCLRVCQMVFRGIIPFFFCVCFVVVVVVVVVVVLVFFDYPGKVISSQSSHT